MIRLSVDTSFEHLGPLNHSNTLICYKVFTIHIIKLLWSIQAEKVHMKYVPFAFVNVNKSICRRSNFIGENTKSGTETFDKSGLSGTHVPPEEHN